MNKQQEAELEFWQWHIHTEIGVDKYQKMREQWLQHYMDRLDMDLSGSGLEVGTGCYSMFNGIKDIDLISIDPLNDEYMKIFGHKRRVKELVADGEALNFPSQSFDYVVCFNVIDHTPDPMQLAQEIKRVLKPTGRFYFEVNFDDELGKPHYDLWDAKKVDKHFGDMKLIRGMVERNPDFPQSCFYAEYQF